MTRRKLVASRSLLIAALLLLAACVPLPASPPPAVPASTPATGAATGAVSGVVADAAGPVAGATVRLRGSLDSTTTDAAGRFTLPIAGSTTHQLVTAWKEGYYPAGADLSTDLRGLPNLEGLTLTLKPHPIADDPSYQWLTSNPDPNVALGCGHCMAAYDEWKLDAHALSAANPRFLSVYNGTDLNGQPSAGPGFRRDSPADPGNCAACHAPAAALAHNGSADINQVSGVETEGVLCDLCHKIGNVTLDAATGLPYQALPGVQAYRLYRPAPGTQLFFGTLDDIPRRVSYSALEKESRFCAPCHSGGWWGVPAYASYDEWLASPYAAKGVTCQACHMPPSGGTSTLTSPCAPADPAPSDEACRADACVKCHSKPADDSTRNPLPDFTLIPERPASTIHTHRMTGVRDEAFMRASVAMTVTATEGSDGVRADVAITNVGAGHHIPTDSPMRNMILVVTALDAAGAPLLYLGSQVVPDWGGVNCGLPNADCGLQEQESASRDPKSQSGNYAGLPGKGFAKVLEDWDGTAPAPQWRNGVRIASDNRIPALATDRSSYAFGLPAASASAPGKLSDRGAVTVEARLILRRAFKAWMDAKGWNEPDLVLAQANVTAAVSDAAVLTSLAAPASTSSAAALLFAPSRAQTVSGERLPAGAFAAPETCGGCHDAEAANWPATGHARATTAPLYQAWFKAADLETLGQLSPYCAGCHTPIGLLSGQIRSRWAWSGRELYPLDAAARGGVACAVCHSIAATTGESNGAYVVDTGPVANSESTAAHAASAAGGHGLVRSAQFCAACHEATLPANGLPVMTTYSEWQRSRFNTGDPRTTTRCEGCHFADGRHGELRPEDLTKAAQVEILAPEEVAAGQEAKLEVRVSNTGAGHDLPTGAAELREMWLAVTVSDATGKVIFSSGDTDPYGDPLPGAVTYGVRWQDASGNPTDRLWEASALLRDHRIPSGGALVETYQLTMPKSFTGSLHVRAALKYRPVSGYLGSLMSTYLRATVPAPPAVEMAADEGEWEVEP